MARSGSAATSRFQRRPRPDSPASEPSLDREHDLAELLPLFEHSMRGSGVCQRNHLVDERPQDTPLDVPHHLVHLALRTEPSSEDAKLSAKNVA